MRRTNVPILCLVLIPLLAACSGPPAGNSGNGGGNPPPASGVNITPSTINLNKGGMQAFSATVASEQDQSVFWTIEGSTGINGDAAHGFISNAGVYVAPTTIPNPPTVTIMVLSTADTSLTGTAVVTLEAGPATSVTIPQGNTQVNTFGTIQFSVTVTGNNNTAVNWQVNGTTGGAAATGAISATGLFSAPNSVPVLTTGNNGGQTSEVVVTAISQADSTASDSVLVTIVPPQQAAQAAPTPLGVSGSNVNDVSTVGGVTSCCGGTLGSLVSRSNNLYILSNNHVLARSDAGTVTSGQTPGDAITQPGLIDNNCQVPPTVASLSQFYNLETGAPPTIDAALAQIISGDVDSTGTILQLGGTNSDGAPTNGQPHEGTGITPAQAMGAPYNSLVAKSGRSTGITCSTIFAINAAFSVEYQKGCGTGSTFSASYTNQVDITNNGFSAEGDSGSLIVTQGTADPVALLFAGSTTDTVANPISQVLAGLPDPTTQETPVFVGASATHPVAACSLPGPQAGIAASMALQKVVATAQGLNSALAARDANAAQLMATFPQVQAVGAGASYDNPAEPAILLFLGGGQTAANLPAQIDGLRTRIIAGGSFALSGALTAEESAKMEQSAPAPQLVYPLLAGEVARAEKVRAAYSDEWMKKPGVQGVGIGSSVDAPGEAALVIFLIKGMQHDAIPQVIDGLRTRVRESDRIRAGVRQNPRHGGCSAPAPSSKPQATSTSGPAQTH